MLELPTRDPREDLHARLDAAPLAHAEALLASLEVLQGLHDRGVLELLRGTIDGGETILETLVDAAKSPESIRGIRNLLIMARIVGSLDPDLLEKFAMAVPDALNNAAKAQQVEPPGFWGVLRILRGKNLRRGLSVVNSLLEAWGRNFSGQRSSANNAAPIERHK
jgi:uncharacterized protein YjgD (DUF1641 family)